MNKYSDSELHLMSYQELRRLSILFHLPANIKKKYMISMIQAHQKGDVCAKTAIFNKIMEERKVKRMDIEGKQTKSFMLRPTTTTQQIPTDLSVATKHEFETRFSYVAHYTSKDNINSGISRIIKQKAEVSRRNKNILQQSRKSSRKLSAGGRTEIMLPRNHSLTTPVRVMPQYERGFPPSTQFEQTTGINNPRNHFQEAYHIHGEYSNALIPSSTHELCRSEAYWPTREVYNNPLMPMLSSLLSPNSATINSSAYGSHHEALPPVPTLGYYESVYIQEEKFWEEPDAGYKKSEARNKLENNNFVDGFLETQAQGSILSEASENSTDFSVDMDLIDPLAKSQNRGNINISYPNVSRCRYVLGHNKYPEAMKSTETNNNTLPSFLSTFCTNGLYNGYSVCRNSFTGTTETHLNPIMTSTYASQFTTAHSSPQQPHIPQNSINGSLIERQWLYPYSESQTPTESNSYANWDEYSDDAGNKFEAHNNTQEVQVVKCRKHGCHYLYPIANPCD